MNANWVHETSTTTGTGNITLAGAATDMRTFTSQFATNARFHYVVDGGSEKEAGIGYLSDSTTLVRESVISSTNSNALVSFSAGTKEVICGPISHVVGHGTAPKPGATIVSSTWNENGSLDYGALDVDELQYWPFHLDYAGYYDSFFVRVNTGGTNIRIGLYDTANGEPNNLIVVHNTSVDITATGNKTITFDEGSTFLAAGDYYTAMVSDGTPSFEGVPDDSVTGSPLGKSSSNHRALSLITVSKSYAVLASTAFLTSVSYFSGTVPLVGLNEG